MLSGTLLLIAIVLVARLATNLGRSETRGARPLRELALLGHLPVREAARAGLLALDSIPGFRSVEWVAVVGLRPHGDTLELGLFRAEDATVIRRMLMPHPYISGRRALRLRAPHLCWRRNRVTPVLIAMRASNER